MRCWCRGAMEEASEMISSRCLSGVLPSLSSLVIALWSFSGGALAVCHPLGRASLLAPLSFDACGSLAIKICLGRKLSRQISSPRTAVTKTLIKFNNNNNKNNKSNSDWHQELRVGFTVYLYIIQLGGPGRADPLCGMLYSGAL